MTKKEILELIAKVTKEGITAGESNENALIYAMLDVFSGLLATKKE